MTPIENRLCWKVHWKAFEVALGRGACFDCAQELGFRATDMPGDKRELVQLHERCARRLQEVA